MSKSVELCSRCVAGWWFLMALCCLPACSDNAGIGDPKASNLDLDEGTSSELEGLPFPNAIAGEERTKPASEPGLANTIARRLALPAHATLDKMDPRLGAVFGTYSENGKSGRYSWVVDGSPASMEQPQPKGDESTALPAQPLARIEASLLRKLQASRTAQTGGVNELVRVVILLRGEFQTRIDETDLTLLTTFDEAKLPSAAELRDRRAARIDVRRAEALRLQSGINGWLTAHGVPASEIGDFWAVNAVSARVPAALVAALSQHPEVARVALDHDLTTTTADRWDGANVKAGNGLNTGVYINNGYRGNRVNPKSGFPISIGVLDFFFADTHPVFQHSAGNSKIVGLFNCKNNMPCVFGLPAPGDGDAVHGSWCASAAAAAAMNGQIEGTLEELRDRTGVAEQTELTFISTGAISDTIRGLQQAVIWASDVVSESFGGGDGVCDGFNAGWESAVYSAHQAGVLVVGSAGNDGHPPDTCKLTGLSEVPSQFVVGALNDPGAGEYATVDIAGGSSGGGIDVTINGSTYSRAFTGVDAVVPGRWAYGAGKNNGFDDVGGTSLAAPQVAGVAALFKDWMIGRGMANQSNYPGVLFTNLLVMTDRTSSSGFKLPARFDSTWGGGRLQARYFLQPDHPSGLWRWEFASYWVAKGAHVQHRVGGVGVEPQGIRTFKLYAVFFEQDGENVADIDMRVYDNGCGTGASLLGYDRSRDMKSMVSIGSGGAGKDVCVDLYGFWVPPNVARLVVLAAYYTDETSMR